MEGPQFGIPPWDVYGSFPYNGLLYIALLYVGMAITKLLTLTLVSANTNTNYHHYTYFFKKTKTLPYMAAWPKEEVTNYESKTWDRKIGFHTQPLFCSLIVPLWPLPI